ncbi:MULTISPECIES: InlB B-repeat-containing protein [Streptomyces]|uniref:InlB B-repeat-containing protein n=1 Tax=Streptomyces TaxID=1883 RepID=UPI0016045300|nr:zinc-dependent metalloprotease family protein [Streptomyces sp. gCLA4]
MTPLRRPGRSRLLALCGTALVALSLASASATGVSAAPAATRAPSPSNGDGPEVLRERTVPLALEDFRKLCTQAPFGAPRTWTFDFFDNVHLTAVEDGIDEDEGTRTWSGHVKGRPDTSVIVSLRGVCSAGRTQPQETAVEVVADLGEHVYQLETLPGRPLRAHITEEDPAKQPHPAPDQLTVSPSARTAPRHSLAGRAEATPDDPAVIDVIAGYTPLAARRAGSEQQVVNTIHWAERKMNEALADSEIPASIEIIGTYNTGYTGDNTSSVMWSKLSNPHDYELGGTAADLRRRYGVDLITVVNSVPGQSSGQGSLPVRGNFDDSLAFSVVDYDSLTGWYNLGHEIGHNLGLFHDRRTLSQQIPDGSWVNELNAAYGTGWITSDEKHTDLMAYPSSCRRVCRTENLYSNSWINVNGQALGDWTNDNAALARRTTPIVAGYRTLTTPPTRYALTLESAGGGSVRPAVYGPYKPGTVVGVTATPHPGYRLAAWIYDDREYAPTGQVNVTMDEAHTLTAIFIET